MEWVGVLRVLLIMVLIEGIRVKVKGVQGFHATSQCVQLGQADYNRKSGKTHSSTTFGYNTYNDSRGTTQYLGYYTIGAYKFTTTHFFLDPVLGPIDGSPPAYVNEQFNRGKCPYKYDSEYRTELCTSDKDVEIRTLAVEQNGVVMPGWLHFEVELKDRRDEILAIYVQVRDEYFNAIGEFVTNVDEQCPADPTLAQPTQYQILPCSAVGFREAKISNAVFMTSKKLLKRPHLGAQFLSPKSIARGIHFTWRLSEYWCNRHLRFRPEAIIFTEKMWKQNNMKPTKPDQIRVYRKAANYWLYPRYFGSADIKLEATTLTCDKAVINYKTGKMMKNPDRSLVAPWLNDKSVESVVSNDYIHTKQQYWDDSPETVAAINGNVKPGDPGFLKGIYSLKSCHANTRHQNQPTFSGRCTHHYEKTPDHNALQGCNLNTNSAEFQDPALMNIPTYQEYVNNLTINRSQLCNTPCRVPVNTSDLVEIQEFHTEERPTQKPKVVQKVNIGDSRNSSKVEKFWAGRKFHGQVLVMWSMFLIPVGNFASRYLKETAMGYPCIGIHIWFWIHLATTVFGVGLVGCGLLALYDIVNTFGRSLNDFGVHHRGTTTTSMVLFVLIAVIGGLRPINYNMRIVTMVLHSVIGFLIYFLNLISIILSTYIPASPSMPDECDVEGRPEGFSGIAVITTIWLVVDLFWHVGMTLLQLVMDRQYEIKRQGFFCPIIPFLPQNSKIDMQGRKIRAILFIVYVTMAFIFTMTAVGLLAGTDIPERCKNLTGPSSCEESWGCSNWAQAYAEKYSSKTSEQQQAAN